MKTAIIRFVSTTLTLWAFCVAQAFASSPFGPESVIVSRVGSTSSTLSGTGNEVYLDEYSSSGDFIQSVPLPTSVIGTNRRLVVAGNNISEGGLSRSADGRFLIVSGYDAAIPYPVNVSGTAGTSIRRIIGRVDHEGNVDTTTAMTDFASTGMPRSVVSMDGSAFWMVGSKGGVRYAPLGATGSILLNNDAPDPSHLGLFGGWLYLSTDGGSPRISSVGTNLPTTAGQNLNGLPGFPNVGSPDGFHLADLSSVVPGFDTLYVADDTIGLMKFSLVNNLWVSNGTIGQDTDDYRGLAAKVTSQGVVLHAVRKALGGAGGGELVKLTDSSGYNGAFLGTPELLATASPGTAFRGVALAPGFLPDLAVSVSAPTHASTNENFNYTINVRNDGIVAATGITVRFSVPPGLVVQDGPDANDFTGPGAAGSVAEVEFTNGTLGPGASATLVLACSSASEGTFLTDSGTPSVDPDGLIDEGNEENNNSVESTRTVVTSSAFEPTVFTWNDGPSGVWSDPTNWVNELNSGTAPSFSGSSNYILNFNASESFYAGCDLASGFNLNRMNLSGSQEIDISGAVIEFTEDGPKLPAITQSGSVQTRITAQIGSTNDLTVAVDGSGPLTLSSGVFGDGALIKSGPGKLLLTMPSSYAGSTIILGGTLALSDDGGPKNILTDGGFERPRFSAEAWSYTPGFSGWTITGTAGIASRYSGWVDETPEGAQVAFLQGEPSSISKTVTITTPGKYTLKFIGANRPGYVANGVKFKIEGNEVTSWDNSHFDTSGVFVEKSQDVNLATGTYAIELAGWNTAGGDVATLIDSVTLVGPSGALPPGSAVELANEGATLDIGNSETILPGLTGVVGSSIINHGILSVDIPDDGAFSGVISGSGAFVKNGFGSYMLTGDNTYTGSTSVGRGLLLITEPTLSDTAKVNISVNGTLYLDFEGTDVVAGLSVDETVYPPGIYNATNLPGRISGDGSLEVIAPTPVAEIAVETPEGADIPDGGSRDFGVIEIGTPGDDTRLFKIKNTGTADLLVDAFLLGIYGIHASDFEVFSSGFIDEFYNLILPPGETGTIGVRFNPTVPGQRVAELLIYNNDPDEGIYIVNLTGSSPAPPVFTTQPDSFTIDHNSRVSFLVAASGVPAPEYQWYVGESGDTSNPVAGETSTTFLTNQLTASTSYWVRATNASGFTDSNTAYITVNPPSLAEIGVSNVVGEAFNSLNSGDTLDFGNGSLATTIFPPIKTIWVANFGSETLANLQVNVTGPDASDFGVTLEGSPENFPTSLGTGASGFFTVYFVPTSEGPKTATLNIFSNDADENPFTITLTANGIVPVPTVTTQTATGVTDVAATLRGSVNPNGNATTAYFEYGATTAYGTTIPVSLSPDDDSNNQNISTILSGLTTGETYHFRVVASNAWGTSYGADQSFVATTGTNEFTFTISDNQVTITGYTGPGGNVVIPATIEGLPVVSIGTGAFDSNTSITSVVIPEGVLSIGWSAFNYCTSLVSVTIPNTVTYIGSQAFRGCSAVTSLFIPESVTYIEVFAFDFMSSLTGFTVDPDNPNYSSRDGVLFNKDQSTLLVFPGGQTGPYTIPAGVTQLQDYAFYYCGALTGVTLPNGLLTIGYGVFDQCDGLTSITIPASVTLIRPGAISDCNNLLAITVDEPNTSYTSQDGVLFNNDLTELIQYPAGKSGSYVVPSTVTSIAGVAFINADGLTGVTLPEGLTSLGAGAFYSCGALQFVNIPGGVAVIGPTTFTYCTSLASVTLSEGLVEIGYSAFEGCSSLTSITIPSTVTTIGNQAFMVCTNLTSAVFYGPAPAMGTNVFQFAASGFVVGYFDANSTGFTAPTWPGYPVTNLGVPAPAIRVSAGGPDLPSGGDLVFGNVNAGVLPGETESLTIRNAGYAPLTDFGFTIDGEHPADFSVDASGLPISLPPGVSGQISVTFTPTASGARLATLNIESNVGPITLDLSGTGTSNVPFDYRIEAGEVYITGYTGPGGAVVIPQAIEGFPVVGIGIGAFSNNTSITSVLIPEGVVSIDAEAFRFCTNMTSVNIPNSVTSIGFGAFEVCTGLTTITIPENVQFIGGSPFGYCRNLLSINVDGLNANYESVNGVLFNETQTTLIQYPAGKPEGSYEIPATVETIGYGSFGGASFVTSVTLPAGLSSIGGSAFGSCSGLTSIVIPNGVTRIRNFTFGLCSNLASVTLPAGLTIIESQAFFNCDALLNIIIPASVTDIEYAAFWTCDSLQTATFLGAAPVMGDLVFDDAAAGFFAGYYAPFEAGFLAPTWPGYPVLNLGSPPPPPSANLANLQVSAGVLAPAFAPAVTAYSVSVANSVNTIALTLTTASNAATVRINGSSVASGVPSIPLPLEVGNNLITIVVTAENGTTTKAYTLVVSRAPSAVIATQPAEIGANRTIVLKGAVIPNGTATVYFEYGVASVSENQTASQVFQGALSQDVTATLTGLPFATAFTYRAVATGEFGTLYGTEQSFTTVQAPPIAATGDPTAVSNSAATLVGAVDPRGLLTEVFFEYGLTNQYGKKTQVRMVTTAGGFQDFLSPSEGLIPNATYHYRIVASNQAGTTFGNDVTFLVAVGSGVTNPIPSTAPEISTGEVVGLTSESAILQGTVNPNRGTTVVQFQIGTTTAYGRATTAQGVGNGTDPVDVSIPVSGLLPGTTYQYRLIAGNSAGTTMGENKQFTMKPAPPSAVTGNTEVVSTTRVRITGSVRAGAAPADVFIDFGTDPLNLTGSIQASPGTVAGITPSAVNGELLDLRQGLIYYYRVRAVGPEGATGVGETRSFKVALLSGLIQQFPDAVPLSERQGSLNVVITPVLATSGWRFFGEKLWRASSVPAIGLTSGDRVIEFRPVAGFIQPPNETVAISSDGTLSSISRSYSPSGVTGSGAVNVTLRPEGITENTRPFELMAKWAIFGEVDNQGNPVWRDSGTSKSDLLPGNHLIIAKSVTGRSTPLPVTVRIRGGETTSTTITYYVAEDPTGTVPQMIDFNTVSNSPELPYAYTGQLRSDAGAGSGFIVRPGVVATAAHVMFDDGTLSSATNMQWLHRHDQQAHDPVPLTPRGYFMLTGYDAQRAADNSPGSSTPQSQNLDAAAAYFLSDPGKGGFSGYLASDSQDNEFLLSSALKILVGYPVDGTPEANLNRMHQSPPANIAFTQGFGKTYITSEIRSSGGGSGGPLCIQYENGSYYPAAIYLGGTAQTVVRAIDSSVADLIGFAESSATLSAGNTAGVITASEEIPIENQAEGELEVMIENAAAREAGAGWRIQASSPYLGSSASLTNLTPNSYTIRFASVPGFVPPAAQIVQIAAGFRKRVTFTYQEIVLPPVVESSGPVTGTRGQPFSYQVEASNSPNAFSLLGNLPLGLLFDTSTGLISGNSGEAGSFNVLIGASNSGGSDSKSLVITSLPALENQMVKVPSNQAMSYTIVSSESGEGVEYAASLLPRGLAFDSSTGSISGTPQEPGSFDVPIQVSRRGATAEAILRMEFTDTLPIISGVSNLNPTIPFGGDATLSVTATGSPQPGYQWYRGVAGVVEEPIVGANQSFYTTMPMEVDATFWVRVFNNSGFVDSQTFTVSVLPSANANLANLIPSSGNLSPAFNAGISGYQLVLPNEIQSIALSAFAEVAQSTVTIQGVSVPLEDPSEPLPLSVGLNEIEITVTAGDGIATQTYFLAVTRGETPTLETGPASDINHDTALLNGKVKPNGKAVVFFQYGLDETYGEVTPGQEVSGNVEIDINAPLFGLVAETLYHFRIGITTGAGTIYGADATFETVKAPPLVATGDAKDTGANEAKLVGAVESGSDVIHVFFEWGETILYGNTTQRQQVPAGTNVTDIQFTAEGLVPGNTYYYRLVAESPEGVKSYGDNKTFIAGQANPVDIVPSQTPSVTTGAATDISAGSANLLGIVNPNGGTTFARFEYGLTASFGSVTASRAIGNGADSTAVVIPLTGLLPGRVYHYRLVASNSQGTVLGQNQTFTTRFPAPLATTGGATPLSPVSARLVGTVRPRGTTARAVFEYGTDGIVFPNSIQASPGTMTGDGEVEVSVDLANLVQRQTYYYRLIASRPDDAASATMGDVRMLEADALYGLVQKFTREVPVASRESVLEVNLTPDDVGAWRFVGESDWRVSGVQVGGLTNGDRLIEYLPVAGYIQPPREQVGIVNGEGPQVLERAYFQTAESGNAGLRVMLGPDGISAISVPLTGRAQWRLTGENVWRDSNAEIQGLSPGGYLVEFKPIPGRNTPPGVRAELINGQTITVTAVYPSANAPILNPPAVVPFATASTSRSFPYAFVGQFRTDAGSQSGFVVKPRVVATTSLAIFNDSTLTRNTGMQWLLQRDNGTYEPTPQVPRGTYVFTGYEAQRATEGTPGTLSLSSQNLNVAALYFSEDAGRGGFSGYLSSGSQTNEFLQSMASKTLVGYPVNGVAEASQGRMHATPLSAASFRWELGRTYSSGAIRGFGGMEGGPLCVQFQNGSYLPAAIHVGGTSRSVVRAIDGEVVDLFNRAEISSNGGDNNTGGGITHSSFTSIGSTAAAAIKVIIEPLAARNAGAGWRLSPETSYRLGGAQKTGLSAGQYNLELRTVAGFEVPATQQVTVTAGQLREVTFTYQEANVAPMIDTVANVAVSQSASSGPIDVILFDADQDESNLVLTGSSSNTPLVPPSGIVFGGSGANRKITITPTSGQLGNAQINLTVSDGSGTGVRAIMVTVIGNAVETWRFANFNTASNSGIAADQADPDGDGQVNISEYAAGTNPNSATDVFKISSSTRVSTTFSTVLHGKAGRSYRLQRRPDLAGGVWENVTNSGVLAVDREITLTDPNATLSRAFYRVSVGSDVP